VAKSWTNVDRTQINDSFYSLAASGTFNGQPLDFLNSYGNNAPFCVVSFYVVCCNLLRIGTGGGLL
jgi:hypothetical protein